MDVSTRSDTPPAGLSSHQFVQLVGEVMHAIILFSWQYGVDDLKGFVSWAFSIPADEE